MPGQCYGCGAEFGLFKKEHGCKNCGFAFCSKCLAAKTIAVPKKNNSKHHVCNKCFKILSGQIDASQQQPATYDLPEAYLKRMAALKDRDSSPQTKASVSQKTKLAPHLQNLEKPDLEIAQRLDKLKEERKPKAKVGDADIGARLAELKGENFVPDKKPVYKPPDRRLQPQQVEDLLEEIAAEVEIDSHRPDHAHDIEARLSRLKADNTRNPINQNTEKSGNSDKTFDNNLDNNLDKESSASSKPNYHKNIPNFTGNADPDKQNLAEIEHLMAEATREAELDAARASAGLEEDKELMERLRDIQKKREEENTADSQSGAAGWTATQGDESVDSADSSEDDDVAAREIIQRYLAEAKIDENVGQRSAPDSSSSAEPGPPDIVPPTSEDFVASEFELPYCCICEDDGKLRCLDCEMDIFCQRCFRECHSEMGGVTDHRTVHYRPPKGYS